MKSKKIMLICNESNSVINFRRELIAYLRASGFKVSLIVGDSERNDDIDKLGVEYRVIPFDNRSKNPLSLVTLRKSFTKYIEEIKPDIVFTFQLKPNVVGPLAASKAGVSNIYSMVEGLGDPFQPTNIKGKLIRVVVSSLYRRAFKKVKRVFFLNDTDFNEFVHRKIVSPKQGVIINGIGIDTNKYPFFNFISPNKEVVLLARLIKNKGIIDFCRIAQKIFERRQDITFKIYGEESELKATDLMPYIDSGVVQYCGFTKDVVNCLKECRIMVSVSSYREGFPRTILEAMACGRPVIASNIVGNKQAVVDGQTGYLLPVHDIDAFANKIVEIIDDETILLKLGQQARAMCVDSYDSYIINKIIFEALTKNS